MFGCGKGRIALPVLSCLAHARVANRVAKFCVRHTALNTCCGACRLATNCFGAWMLAARSNASHSGPDPCHQDPHFLGRCYCPSFLFLTKLVCQLNDLPQHATAESVNFFVATNSMADMTSSGNSGLRKDGCLTCRANSTCISGDSPRAEVIVLAPAQFRPPSCHFLLVCSWRQPLLRFLLLLAHPCNLSMSLAQVRRVWTRYLRPLEKSLLCFQQLLGDLLSLPLRCLCCLQRCRPTSSRFALGAVAGPALEPAAGEPPAPTSMPASFSTSASGVQCPGCP